MKTKRNLFLWILFFLVFIFVPVNLITQENNSACKVLKKEIAETYEGNCKKGLAHGEGTAKGIDSYTGKFKAGLPHGFGTYYYSDGSIYKGEWKKGLRNGNGDYKYKVENSDSLLSGYWKDDKYLGKSKSVRGYTITRNNGIPMVSCIRSGDGDDIELILTRGGIKIIPENLYFTLSSGYQEIFGNIIYLKEIKFPFEGNVRYKTLNQLGNYEVDCELGFKIELSGKWKVYLKH